MIAPQSKIPSLVKGGVPLGTKFQYSYKKNDSLECVNELAKVSATEWYERPFSENPAGCDGILFTFTERESNDPSNILLYDESRNALARLRNTERGQLSPMEWRLVSKKEQWGAIHLVSRIK